jgi:hypothetical protein
MAKDGASELRDGQCRQQLVSTSAAVDQDKRADDARTRGSEQPTSSSRFFSQAQRHSHLSRSLNIYVDTTASAANRCADVLIRREG